jgi:hypothetical protein
MQKLISAGFATIALASVAVPAFAYTYWNDYTYRPDIDFEWYQDVGKPLNAGLEETTPAPRAGYIWAPGRYQTVGAHQVWVAGHWVKDDFAEDVAALRTATTAP